MQICIFEDGALVATARPAGSGAVEKRSSILPIERARHALPTSSANRIPSSAVSRRTGDRVVRRSLDSYEAVADAGSPARGGARRAPAEAVPSLVGRIKRNLVGLKCRARSRSSTSRCAGSSAAR